MTLLCPCCGSTCSPIDPSADAGSWVGWVQCDKTTTACGSTAPCHTCACGWLGPSDQAVVRTVAPAEEG